MKEEITLKNFPIVHLWDDEWGWCPAYIQWSDIEKVLGKKRYKDFMKFMEGQTSMEKGVYPVDVENFLSPLSKRFFD